MANQEQLEILKQSAEKWNKWREENSGIIIALRGAKLGKANLDKANLSRAYLKEADLSRARLDRANLGEADLIRANLSRANLRGADLSRANLDGANLDGANLSGADLIRANLNRANLITANLSRANLTEAHLMEVDLRGADLREADFSQAILRGADLSGADFIGRADLSQANLRGADLSTVNLSFADLRGANLTGSQIGGTIFGNNDLSGSLGLETIVHGYPSTIGTDTISNSKGKIPIEFLRGCGLNDWEIEAARLHDPALSNEEVNRILYKMYDLRATQALQISPLFISYSHGDGKFVDKIGACLTEKGVRYWRDIHDMKAGRMEKQIDVAIRQNPTVLLVLSKNSLQSDWVEHEVRTARSLEKEMGRDVLCPVALDDSWKSSPWPRRVMEQVMEYNILDCAGWENNNEFERMFARLVDGLDLYYKKDQ